MAADPVAAHVPAPLGGTVTARVAADGSVHAVDARAGADLVHRLDPLARYAVAFNRSQLRQTRFVWVGDRRWHAVSLARERRAPGDDGPASVLVEIETAAPPYGLTLRELDVLTLLCGGLSNPEIASHLGASARTVSTHVGHVLEKLGQASRAGAAALAVDQGLVRVPVPGGGRALGMLGIGLVDQIAAGLMPSARRIDRGWHGVLRPRLHPIRLGTLVDTSTGEGGDGQEMRDGAALAVAMINERGGIAGRRIEQVAADVEIADAATFGPALERLVAHDVDAIVTGYVLYAEADAYAVARDHGCPILTTMTSAEQARWVREDPSRYGRVFQACPTELVYGTGAIAFLEHAVLAGGFRPARRSVLPIETAVDGGQPFGDEARDAAERAGWELAAPLVVPHAGVDWDAVLRHVERVDPAAIVLTHFAADEAAAFQRAFRRAGSRALVYMVFAPSSPRFAEAAGEAAEGVIWSTVTGTYADRAGRAFRARFAATYGRDPGHSLAGSAFDQVHILALAWACVGDARRFAAVADELRTIRYRGVNGAYDLGGPDQTGRAYPHETADPSLGMAHLVFQVQDGEHRVIHPAPYAETPLRLPAWVAP